MSFDAAPQTERRLTLRLLAYWEKLRRGRPMPAEGDISSDDIKDLWPYCFVIRLDTGGVQHVHYIGDELARMLKEDINRENPVMRAFDGDQGWYQDMRQNPRPLLDEGEIRNAAGQAVRYRQCLLPLGDKDQLTGALGAMNCKVF